MGKASSATTLAVTAAGGVDGVGVPITLTATVTDASHTTAVPGGTVEFEDGGSPVIGCTAVTATAGVAHCTDAPAPTTLTPVTFAAVYCPAASGDCLDWSSSTSPTATYAATPDPTTVTLSPAGTQTHPVTATGGQAVTMTATVAIPAGSATVGGKVTFKENSKRITASGGGHLLHTAGGPDRHGDVRAGPGAGQRGRHRGRLRPRRHIAHRRQHIGPGLPEGERAADHHRRHGGRAHRHGAGPGRLASPTACPSPPPPRWPRAAAR